MNYLVVMAGGSGTRFWPKSTSSKPKQFLSFSKSSADTLLVQTVRRFNNLVKPENCLILTTDRLTAQVKDQILDSVVLSEPQARNTAPCVFWAAKEVYKRDPNAVMLVMPADHYIPNILDFEKTVKLAIDHAIKTGDLVTLGVKPTRPETGYGYLKIGSAMGSQCFKVDAFIEKPDHEKAQAFIKSGNYLWNGGMFVWKASSILASFDKLMPEMQHVWNKFNGDAKSAYPELTATSIDFGIMEKANNVSTFTLDCGWDDLGSWVSVENLALARGEKNDFGAVLNGEVIGLDSSGCVIDVSDRQVALLGVHDLIIVQTDGVLMIADKRRSQDIKLLVEKVKLTKPSLT